MNKYDDEVQNALDALRNRRNSEQKVYSDTPLLFTASQMKSYTPPEYQQMRRLQNSYEAAYKPSEWLFLKQAEMMADYEDDATYTGVFSRYYPTYKDMTNEQLRGYFTWRTKVRKGLIEKTSPGFVFVYIFELLNGIGWSDAYDGYKKLCGFAENYSVADSSLRLFPYIDSWKRSFILYYGLDKAYIINDDESQQREAVKKLACRLTNDDNEIFALLMTITGYKPEKAQSYQKSPSDFKAVVCRIYRKINEFFASSESPLNFWGTFSVKQYTVFSGAVFYEQKRHADTNIVIDETESYHCENGKWYRTSFELSDENIKSLCYVIKNIDCEMRKRLGCKRQINHVTVTAFFDEITQKEIDDYFEEKRIQSMPKISIDVSVLDAIRETSLATQQKLIVEPQEQQDAWQPENVMKKEKVEAPPQPKIQCDGLPVDENERDVLIMLLNGENPSRFCREKGLMLSVVCESINEKLFDIFEDTVIEGFEEMKIVEDYARELRTMTGGI